MKRKRDSGGRAVITLGLVALGEKSSAYLDTCRARLAEYLGETFPDFDWVAERSDWPGGRGETLRLLDRAQAEMEERGWQFCFLVSASRAGGQERWGTGEVYYNYSTAVIDLSPSHLPQEGEDSSAPAACWAAILDCFARLNGLTRLAGRKPAAGTPDEDAYGPDEIKALNRSLHGLADGTIKRGVKEVRSAALYLGILFTHPLRVLRSVFSHRPLRMVFSLGKLVFAAMAALVLALLSTELWHLGVGINVWRLVIIAVAVLLASTVYVVFQQRLYVRRVALSLSERAAFFNLTSFLTVLAVFLALFVVIIIATMIITVGVYPRYIVREWLGKADVNFWDYVRVSLLIGSLAMVVGALGAGLEENDHFRRVMYADSDR